MHVAGLVIVCVSLAIGIYYYVFYGRFHNSLIPQTQIIYQPTPVPTKPLKPVVFVGDTTQHKLTTPTPAGYCMSLSQKQNIMEMYKNNAGKDCGIVADNEAVIEEGDTKKVRDCIKAGLVEGACTQHKAFVAVTGFEGVLEEFVSTENCQIKVSSWATSQPQCGFAERTCGALSDRFPFTVCDN